MTKREGERKNEYGTTDKTISTNEEIKRYNVSNLAEFVQTIPNEKEHKEEYGNIKGSK
jgi:hypothetical protein